MDTPISVCFLSPGLSVSCVFFYHSRIDFLLDRNTYGMPTLFDTLEDLSDEDGTGIQKVVVWLHVLYSLLFGQN